MFERHGDGQPIANPGRHSDSKAWAQRPWLSFEVQTTEAIYWRYFARTQVRTDTITCATLAVICALIGICSTSRGLMAAATVTCMVQAAAACIQLSRGWSAGTIQYRGPLITAIRLASALCLSMVLVPAGAPALQCVLLGGKVLHLAVLPLGLRLPFLQNLVVQAVSLAVHLPGIDGDCAHVMAWHGGRQVGHVLEIAAEVLNQASHLLQAPLKVQASSMPLQQACPCLLGFALTMCGFILPTIALYITEARDRAAFRRLKSGHGRTDKAENSLSF
ncbi:g11508 [Coccomyxa elongata]